MTVVTQEDLTILGKTVYGEARGEDDLGRRAVVHPILNRWRNPRRRRDHSIAATCLRWRQFSCWNVGNPNRAKLMAVSTDDPVFRRCLAAALAALDETDFTLGSTHYHTRSMRKPPKWARGHEPCFETAAHLFYNDVR